MPESALSKTPYSKLLDDADFRRWFDNARRGSPITGYEWLRRMGFIQKKFGKSPKQIAAMNQKQAVNFLLDMVGELEKEKRSGSYISNLVKPVKSWLEFNGKPVVQKIKIPGRGELTRFADERPPTQEELGRILNAADLRAKVACSLVAFSGIRLEVLGSFLGDEGLKVGDLPEMTVGDGSVEVEQVPAMIAVRKTLSKMGNPFFTFISAEGCDYLKQYLELRMRRGEKLTPKSALITPIMSTIAGNHIRTTNIGDLMRKPIRDAGFQWRPYVLRRYFDTRLMMAEADGLIIRDWRVFWMGHKGDIEATYTVSKRLPEDVIERMRESYAKSADKYLATTKKQTTTQEQIVATFNRKFLEMSGYSAEEIDKMGDLTAMTSEQVQELMKKKSMQALGLNGNTQRVVPMVEVKQWIAQGWEYVSTLPTNEAIIKLPL